MQKKFIAFVTLVLIGITIPMGFSSDSDSVVITYGETARQIMNTRKQSISTLQITQTSTLAIAIIRYFQQKTQMMYLIHLQIKVTL